MLTIRMYCNFKLDKCAADDDQWGVTIGIEHKEYFFEMHKVGNTAIKDLWDSKKNHQKKTTEDLS